MAKEYGSNMYKRRSQGNKGNLPNNLEFFCRGKGPSEIWTNKRHLGNLVGFEKRSGEKVLIEFFIDLENEVLDVF